jgi:uncharacterized membrane protein (DUF106 family)
MRLATVEIMVLATVFAFVSYYLSKTLGKRDEVRASQKRFNDHVKEMQAAMKRNDEAKLKELQKKDEELNKEMMKTMFLPFRSMIVILPLYYVLWNFLLPAWFPDYSVRLPFSLPGRMDFWSADAWRPWFGARGFFIWSTVVAGLVIVEGLWAKVEARVIQKLFKRGEAQKPSQ